jgi:hypothetical protein
MRSEPPVTRYRALGLATIAPNRSLCSFKPDSNDCCGRTNRTNGSSHSAAQTDGSPRRKGRSGSGPSRHSHLRARHVEAADSLVRRDGQNLRRVGREHERPAAWRRATDFAQLVERVRLHGRTLHTLNDPILERLQFGTQRTWKRIIDLPRVPSVASSLRTRGTQEVLWRLERFPAAGRPFGSSADGWKHSRKVRTARSATRPSQSRCSHRPTRSP